MIICKVGAFYNLCDERPKFERLVGSLVVEYKVNPRHFFILCDEKEAAEKFLLEGERSLPDFCDTDLFENPFKNVGHLHRIAQISLERIIGKRTEKFRD